MKLKRYLDGILSKKELEILAGSYDVVGDIAIAVIPEGLDEKESLIGEAILESNKRIRVVAKRDGFYSGEYRTVALKIIAGENRKETVVKEFGLRLKLNVETVYYSIRSGNERKRVASLVRQDEQVLVLFSGIAPYPLVISKFSKARMILGVEKNPEAHAYAIQNLKLNRGCNNVELHKCDAKVLLPGLIEQFDRVVMPLPTKGEEYLLDGIRSIKPGGWLHFYTFVQKGQFESSIDKVLAACIGGKRRLGQAKIIKCGHTAPKTHRVCVDARIY